MPRTGRPAESGAVAVQLLVILVPVLFAFLGFAIDLGRLYLDRGEVKTAANAMALAAAQKLTGTDAALEAANTAARLAVETGSGFSNRYDFGSRNIGESEGTLTSTIEDLQFFDTVSAVIGEGGGAESGSAAAKYVRATIRAEAPLTFWSFLSLGQERRVNVAATAVAGISAPLCTACGIEPLAIAAIDSSDTTEFGFTRNTRYTFGYFCVGGQTPPPLPNTERRIPYLILNRYNEEATLFPDEGSQLYRIGAQGLPPSASQTVSCVRVNGEEQIWVNAAPLGCNNRVQAHITYMLCGMASRFESQPPALCVEIPEVDTIASAQIPDTDLADLDDYATYTGNQRRVITVPIVETLSQGGTMTVLGFRQFLVEPAVNDVTINANDQNGRFRALYIGSPAPIRQGSFTGCTQTAGPGKVVLHQ